MQEVPQKKELTVKKRLIQLLRFHLPPQFEVVSDAHELNTICIEFLLEPSPIVTSLYIVVFIVDGTYDVSRREPPLIVGIIPYGSHFAIIEKAYRHSDCYSVTVLQLEIQR